MADHVGEDRPPGVAAVAPDRPYAIEDGLTRRRDPAWLPLTFWLYLPLAVAYVIWRPWIVNWASPLGLLSLGLEYFVVFNTVLFLWMTRAVWVPVHRPISASRTVDAVITTATEPLEIIEPTVAAAMRVRGIRDVLVLDDGARPEVAELAQRHGARWVPRRTDEHAKAGNLNHGLLHTDAEFLLELDVDHVPRPEFLERTLGYFDDPALAVVQAPQTYYNTGSFLFRRTRGGLWSEQGMFYDTIQPAKNRYNSAFFVGTSAVLRRRALDSIGGYATGTATEDIHTALRLHAAGWKSLFLPETLAQGLEAASLKEFFRQRRRWGAGSLGLLFRSKDSPLWARGLTWAQRLNYLSATVAHLQGLHRALFMLLPVLTILLQQPPILAPNALWILPMLCFACVSIGFTALCARGTYHPVHTEAYGLASWAASLAALWGIVRVQRKFSVSRKVVDRREGQRLKAGIWILAGASGLGLMKGAWSLADAGHWNDALTATRIVATGLCLFYVALLVSFLVNLARYERGARSSHELAVPGALAEPAGFPEVLPFAAFEAVRRDRELEPANSRT